MAETYVYPHPFISAVFIVTVSDRTIRWIGNAEEMAKPLADTLAKV